VPASISVVESPDRPIAPLIRNSGLGVASVMTTADLSTLDRQPRLPDVLVIDMRGETAVPSIVGTLKRRHPQMGIILVGMTLEPALMLEAMRAGITELVPEPVDQEGLRTAIDRVVGDQAHTSGGPGKIFAFVGAKGGVGTTTLAVNVAAALAQEKLSQVAMIDLHIAAHGDVALLLGVEPRFSVVDAIDNTNRLDASYLKSLVSRASTGLDVLASPERPSLRAPDGQQVRAMLERVAVQYRTVVIDVPRTDFGLLDSLDPVSVITLVVNQELPTVRRAAQIAAMMRQRYGKERVAAVVTRYDSRADIGQEDIERVVGLPVWATFPSDYRKVLAAANAGRPLVTDNHSRLATSVAQFAARLAGPSRGADAGKAAQKPGRLGGFF
jgi:pilus assembly protein CpaE